MKILTPEHIKVAERRGFMKAIEAIKSEDAMGAAIIFEEENGHKPSRMFWVRWLESQMNKVLRDE